MCRGTAAGCCTIAGIRSRVTSCWWRIFGSRANKDPSSGWQQYGFEKAAKPRQHVLSIEAAVGGHEGLAAVVAIDPCEPALRVDDPHEPRSRGEPIGDF